MMSFSNLTDHLNTTTGSSMQPELLVFAVFKIVLAPITVVSNGFLVLTAYVDPLRAFRAPSSSFLIAMSVANVFTGLIVEPIFATLEYNDYFGKSNLPNLAKVGSSISLLTLNVSFGMVFALAVDYFIAVFRPTKYKSWITMQRAQVVIAVISINASIFSILPHANVSMEIVFKVDLYLNSTVNSTLLVVSYILLYFAFHDQTKRSLNLRRAVNNPGRANTDEVDKIVALQNKFCRVLLIFVIFSTIPAVFATISYYLMEYCDPCQRYKAIVIFQKVCLHLMFIKCALDPFAFAWRLSRNRQALKKIILCQLGMLTQMRSTVQPDNISS